MPAEIKQDVIDFATRALSSINLEKAVPLSGNGLSQNEEYSLPDKIPGLLEMYHTIYRGKIISVLEYSVSSCSYYSSTFDLRMLQDKELYLLMLVHGLSTNDICLSSLAVSLVAAAPKTFMQFTSEDQVTWLTGSRYCDENWIKNAVERLEFIRKTKIVTVPDSMVESIIECSKIQEKKAPPQRKEVLVSDIVNSSIFKEVLKKFSSILEEKIKQVISFSKDSSKYSPMYVETTVWSTDGVYWHWQSLFLILLWSLLKGDTFLSSSTIELLSTLQTDKEMMEIEDVIMWLTYDFIFKSEELTKAAKTLKFLKDSANIDVPQFILNIFLPLPQISAIDDISWSQVEFLEEIPAESSSSQQEQDLEPPPQMPSSEEVPEVSSNTVEIPHIPCEENFILVIGEKVQSSSDSQSSINDVIEISDDEVDDKSRLNSKLSDLHGKDLLSSELLEQVLLQQREIIRNQENVVMSAIQTLTNRIEKTEGLLDGKGPSEGNTVQAQASGSGKSRKSSMEHADKHKVISSVDQNKGSSDDTPHCPQVVSKPRQCKKDLHPHGEQKVASRLSDPVSHKDTFSKIKKSRGRPRKSSLPDMASSPPSKNTEKVRKSPGAKNIPEPDKNPVTRKKYSRKTRSARNTL